MHRPSVVCFLLSPLALGIGSSSLLAAFPFGNASIASRLAGAEPSPPVLDEVDELVAEGRWEAAEELLRQWTRDREDPGIQLRLAELLLQRGWNQAGGDGLLGHLADALLWEAQALFEEVARSSSAEAADQTSQERALTAWLGAARCFEALADPEAAQALLEEAQGALPGSLGSTLLEEGLRIDLDSGRLAELEARLPSVGDRLDETSRSLWQLRLASEMREAERCAELALQLGGMEDHAWEIGWRLWAAHQGQEGALELLLHRFSQLVSAHPSALEYRYYRGEVRVRAGDHAGAESDLLPCLPDPELEILARFALGRALLGQGRVDEAAEEFRTVVRARDQSWRQGLNGLLDVAVRHGTAGRHQRALEVYQEVLAEDPSNEFALLGIPLCHKGMEDVLTAEAEYREALQVLPDHAQLRNDLALLVRGAGREGEARELFLDATSSGSVDAMENLGVIAWWDDGEPAPAAEWFARVLAVEPDRAKSRFYRELALSRLRREQRSTETEGAGPGGR